MSRISEFPVDSYLRVFHAPRVLTAEEKAFVEKELDQFVSTWKAEMKPVTGAWEIVHDQFVVIAADETVVPLSGCAKDAMTRMLRDISAQLGIDFVHGPPICFRDGDRIRAVGRDEFGELVEKGEVTAETKVFDNTIVAVGPYREGRWEVPARESWHGRAYNLKG